MSVMALDVGTKRIGVAISDPGGTFAIPVTVVQRTTLSADLQQIAQLIGEYKAGELVVGDPLRLSGERGSAAEYVDRFVVEVSAIFDGPIHRVDERLTTAQAERSLIAADLSRSKRKSVIDKMAAALILETFLSRRRSGAARAQ